MTKQLKERLEWLDAVKKGICIILIMLSHYCNIPHVGYYLFAGYVQVFFITSGYTFKNNISKKAIFKRMKRLLTPYFFWGSFFWLILYLLKKQSVINLAGLIYSRYSLFPTGINDNILLLGYNSPLWFLTALFIATLLTYLFFYLKNKKTTILLLITYIGISILMKKLPILLPWSFDTAFIASLLIVIGYYIKNQYILHLFKMKVLTIIVLTFFYILLVLFTPNINMSVREYGNNGILIFILIGIIEFFLFSLIFQLLENTRFTKIISKIGRSSLRILCIHFPLFILISPYLTNNNYINSILIGGAVILFAFKSENKLSKFNL